MTKEVVSVGPDTPTRQVAKLLLEKGISAVPVVDDSGAPIGMISEGDLIGRTAVERERRREWWLEMLSEGTMLSTEFLDFVNRTDRPARQVMATPVVTVGEDAPVDEIAQLLEAHRIKRVPVVRDGRVVGIVSRADLLRALAVSRRS
jgi:CBS domain-containing protein